MNRFYKDCICIYKMRSHIISFYYHYFSQLSYNMTSFSSIISQKINSILYVLIAHRYAYRYFRWCHWLLLCVCWSVCVFNSNHATPTRQGSGSGRNQKNNQKQREKKPPLSCCQRVPAQTQQQLLSSPFKEQTEFRSTVTRTFQTTNNN